MITPEQLAHLQALIKEYAGTGLNFALGGVPAKQCVVEATADLNTYLNSLTQQEPTMELKFGSAPIGPIKHSVVEHSVVEHSVVYASGEVLAHCRDASTAILIAEVLRGHANKVESAAPIDKQPVSADLQPIAVVDGQSQRWCIVYAPDGSRACIVANETVEGFHATSRIALNAGESVIKHLNRLGGQFLGAFLYTAPAYTAATLPPPS